jgi:predicted SAM-dependent methyltransferase
MIPLQTNELNLKAKLTKPCKNRLSTFSSMDFAITHGPRAKSYKLRDTNYELRVASYELLVTSYELQDSRYELQAKRYEK